MSVLHKICWLHQQGSACVLSNQNWLYITSCFSPLLLRVISHWSISLHAYWLPGFIHFIVCLLPGSACDSAITLALQSVPAEHLNIQTIQLRQYTAYCHAMKWWTTFIILFIIYSSILASQQQSLSFRKFPSNIPTLSLPLDFNTLGNDFPKNYQLLH